MLLAIDILTLILLIIVAALCIYFFVTLKKLNRSIDVLSADVHRLIDSTIPLVEELRESSKNLNRDNSGCRTAYDGLQRICLINQNKSIFFINKS
ncbi:MAG: DUF948 domain-containing protein [Melioribacteraceae bacterium]|nr:DUF948 domain-containing protein [Melioribacteraceae bacterium]